MAYGTPRAPEEIEAYYTDIRRGRAPSPEQLADLIRRYEAIGGISPLAGLTEAQRVALQAALDERAPGRLHRRSRPEARRAEDRGRRRRARRRRRRAHRRAGAGPALLVDVDRRVPRPGRRRRGRAGVPFAGIESWATEPAYVDVPRRRGAPRAGHDAGEHQGRVHGPLAAAAHPRDRRPVPGRVAVHGRGRRRRRRPRPVVAVVGRLAIGRAAHPSRGSAPTSSPSSTTWRPPSTPMASWSARAGSSPTISRCSTTSTSRPGGGPRIRASCSGARRR